MDVLKMDGFCFVVATNMKVPLMVLMLFQGTMFWLIHCGKEQCRSGIVFDP